MCPLPRGSTGVHPALTHSYSPEKTRDDARKDDSGVHLGFIPTNGRVDEEVAGAGEQDPGVDTKEVV